MRFQINSNKNYKADFGEAFLAKLGASTGFSLSNLVVGFAKIKLMATLLDPAMFGRLNLLQQIVSTAVTISTLGADSTCSREACAQQNKRLPIFYGSIAKIYAALVLALALASLGLGFYFRSYLENTFSSWRLTVLVIVLTVAFSSIYFLNNSLLAQQKRIGLLQFNVLMGNFSLVGFLFASYLLGINDVNIAILVILPSFVTLVFSFYTLRMLDVVKGKLLKSLPSSDAAISKSFIALGVTMLASSIINPVAQLIYRTVINNEMGSVSLGYFAAISGLSIAICSPIANYLYNYYFRSLMDTKGGEAKGLFYSHILLTFFLLILGYALVLGFGEFVITQLLSDRYSSQIEFFKLWLFGEIIRTVNQCLSLIALARQDKKYILGSEVVWAICITTCFVFLSLGGYELIQFGWTYITLNATFFVISFFYHKVRKEI
jgi:O-antigen/teichoic acid export membrane protein